MYVVGVRDAARLGCESSQAFFTAAMALRSDPQQQFLRALSNVDGKLEQLSDS